jgi:hypothetical protein
LKRLDKPAIIAYCNFKLQSNHDTVNNLMATKVMSLRFAPQQMERLQRVARRLGRTPSETGALLVEESLRRSEFALIDFRDSVAGRQAYVQGSSLAVWEVVMIARSYGTDDGKLDAEKTAGHLNWPLTRVQAALAYAAAFPEEMEAALSDNGQMTVQELQRLVPGVRVFEVPLDGDAKAGPGRKASKKKPSRKNLSRKNLSRKNLTHAA